MRLLITGLSLFFASGVALIAGDGRAETKGSESALKRLSWLIGTWKSTDKEKVGYEVWRADSSACFVGEEYTMKGSEKTWSEKLRIEATDSGLFYVADVAHNAGPVQFKMTSQDSNMTVFENPEHDFPTRIIYKKVGVDSLHARIEGLRKGKTTGVDFMFSRVK